MNLNFAIVGCGYIAMRHAENIIRHGKLVAVCDIVPEKAKVIAQKYQARPFFSFDEMLEQEPSIGIVVVCTPNGLHAEHSIKALQKGKHVICEKPMCISFPAALSMRDTAHFFRRHLFIVKQNRYNPPVRLLKDLLDQGRLGAIVSVQINGFWNRGKAYFRNSWKGTAELDGGILYTQFSHFIDLLIWLFGDIRKIKAFKKNLILGSDIETEDNIVVIAELENQALCSLHFSISSYQQNMEGSITVIGEKGTIKIGGQYLNTLEYIRVEGEEIMMPEASSPANDYGFYQGSMSNHDKVYNNIMAILEGGKGAHANAEDGLKTVEVIERIYHACR
ncbi:MAG: gfo/Idh/MocA family oxidoreductase [Terrimonas sp.]|nr:gfo/Idh/MocA family oxidoreductase [Terrimonas sp.]